MSTGGEGWELLRGEEVLEDSPFFRSALQNVEDEVEEAGKWLDSFIKNLRTALELSLKLTDFLVSLEENIGALQDLPLLNGEPSRLKRAACTVNTVLNCTEKILIKLIRRLEQKMVGPLLQNMLESVRELKEFRRSYERLVEKYDGYLAKPERAKDPIIREESYVAETLEYLARLRQFKSNFELGLLEKVSVGLGGFGEFCWALGQLFRSLEGDIEVLRGAVPKWQEFESERLASLKQVPRPIDGITLLERLRGGKKSGWLYKKSSGKGLSGKGYWRRTFAQLDGSSFTLTGPGRLRGGVQLISRVNVLLCEVRTVEASGSQRSCFEIYTSQKSWILCCPDGGDEEVREWLRAFEAAKSKAFQATETQPSQEDPVGGIKEGEEEDEDQEGEEVPLAKKQNELSEDQGYLLSKEHARLKLIVQDLPAEEMTLAYFCAIVRVGCENYLSGRVFATIASLYLLPATLLLPGQGDSEPFIRIPFGEILSLETVPSGENLLAKMDVKMRPEHTSTIGTQEWSLMVIDPSSLDIVARLFRNCRAGQPKSVPDLMRELSLSSRPSIISASSLANEQDNKSDVPVVECGCEQHLDQVQVDMILPVDLDTLNTWLTSADSPVMEAVYAGRKYSQIETGPWTDTGDGKEARSVKFNIPMSNPLLKAKETTCYEQQTRTIHEPGRRHILDVEARTPQVPYGDTFVTLSRTCMCLAGPGRSRLILSFGMTWLKSPLVKSIIRDAAMKGFGRYCELVVEALKRELAKLKPNLAPDELVMVEQQPIKPISDSDQTSTARLLLDVVGEAGLSTGSFIKQYPLPFASILLVCCLLWSWYMSSQLIKLARLKPYTLLDPTASAQLDDAATWMPQASQDPTFGHIYKDLELRDGQLVMLGQEVVEMAKDLFRLRQHLGEAKYMTWLADSLAACYQQNQNPSVCKPLELKWKKHLNIQNNIH